MSVLPPVGCYDIGSLEMKYWSVLAWMGWGHSGWCQAIFCGGCGEFHNSGVWWCRIVRWFGGVSILRVIGAVVLGPKSALVTTSVGCGVVVLDGASIRWVTIQFAPGGWVVVATVRIEASVAQCESAREQVTVPVGGHSFG